MKVRKNLASAMVTTATLAGALVATSSPAGAADAPGGWQMIYNVATGKCVDLPGTGDGIGQIGGPVQQHRCITHGDNQWFLFERAGQESGFPLYVIRNTRDNVCLDVGGHSSPPAGAKVGQWLCVKDSSDNQRFFIEEVPGGVFIRENKSKMCLDVDGHKDTRNDVRLTLAPCDIWTHDDHRWNLRPI